MLLGLCCCKASQCRKAACLRCCRSVHKGIAKVLHSARNLLHMSHCTPPGRPCLDNRVRKLPPMSNSHMALVNRLDSFLEIRSWLSIRSFEVPMFHCMCSQQLHTWRRSCCLWSPHIEATREKTNSSFLCLFIDVFLKGNSKQTHSNDTQSAKSRPNVTTQRKLTGPKG